MPLRAKRSNPGYCVHRDCHARLGLARNDKFLWRLLTSSFVFALLALPLIVFAAEAATNTASTTRLVNPLGDDATTIPLILGRVMRAGFGVLGAVALFMFIYGGFRWLTSGGSPDSIKAGRDTMVWATLGIAVIFASYAIVNFIISAIAK